MTTFKSNLDNPSLYVGTYAKYNNGSIEGNWLDLTDYHDAANFYEACKELHKDEVDPEFMFQGFSGFPKSLYSECGGINDIYEYIDFINDSELEASIVDAGLYLGIPLENILDAYIDSHDSDKDFAYQLAEDTGFVESNTWPSNCIDWDQAAREIMYDYNEHDGHYFSNNW